MTRSLLGVAWHPGAVRAVAPVVAEAERQGWRTLMATCRASIAIAKRAGVSEPLTLKTAEQAAELLNEVLPETVLLAGVSEGNSAEKHAIVAARAAGRRTCAVLDNWGRYQERLTACLGPEALPDVIAVMNDEARRAISADGFFDGAVIVTGHPGLDEFHGYLDADDEQSRFAARRQFECAAHQEVVVFASQPLAQQFEATLGYDQYGAASMLSAALAPGSVLMIALHPRESAGSWEGKCPHNGVVIRDYDPVILYLAADIVTSCFSAALTEAVLIGRPAISIQPGGRGRDELWTNKCGATFPVYDRQGLLAALGAARAMARPELIRRRRVLDLPGDATKRVLRVVDELRTSRSNAI